MAPAGAGKTFVALHRVLRLLRARPEATALFVARNAALATFAGRVLIRICLAVRARIRARFARSRPRPDES